MNLSEIRDFLDKKGISVTELSTRMNRQRSYISAILSGKKPLSDDIRAQIEAELLKEGYMPQKEQVPILKMIVSMLVKEHVSAMPSPNNTKKEITQVIDREPDLSVYVGVF